MKRAEIIIGACTAAILILFIALGAAEAQNLSETSGSIGTSIFAWAAYYGRALGGSLGQFLYYAVLLVCLLVIALVIWSLGGGFINEIFLKRSSKNNNYDPRRVFLSAARRSREVLLIIPAILFVGLAGIAMGEANEFARARLADGMVAGWEHAFFGSYMFAALGAIHYPHWLIVFIIFSFENMSLMLVGAGIVLAYLARDRFRELLVAFCIGILAMVPLWLLIPALSPQDRFMNNVYNLPNAPALALVIENYHPQPEIADFLASVRTDKASLPALPTSTIPSAHVFWAALAGYYLFRLRRPYQWIAWVALPFLIASTFGTILLAQHYFMDIPAGFAIAALAIWLAHDLENVERLRVLTR